MSGPVSDTADQSGLVGLGVEECIAAFLRCPHTHCILQNSLDLPTLGFALSFCSAQPVRAPCTAQECPSARVASSKLYLKLGVDTKLSLKCSLKHPLKPCLHY